MPRNIGSVTDSLLSANEFEEWDFVKIEFPSPTGTLRYTNKPGGFIGNIDGTSQTWSETDYEHGPLSQSNTEILVVSWIQFANLDFNWTDLVYDTPIRNVPVTLYQGVFDPTTNPSTFVDKYIEYEGTLDEGEFDIIAKMTLKPHHTPWYYKIPRGRMEGRCINTYRDPDDCQYTGPEPTGQVTCGYTRFDCRLRSNEININIYDDLPKPGEQMMYGGERHGLAPAPNLGE